MSVMPLSIKLLARRLNCEHAQRYLRFYRTSANTPLDFGLSERGKFYEIPVEELTSLGLNKTLPKAYRKQFDTLGECVSMCRGSLLETLHCMKAVRPSFPPIRVVLWGKLGTGKSMTLCQAVHAAYTGQWVVVHHRDAMALTRKVNEVEMSTWKTGRINDPLNAVTILQNFKQQNAALWKSLAELKTQKTYEWTKNDKTLEGRPITEIVEMGISAPFMASDCVGALFKELRHNASLGRLKLFVAIDHANSLYGKTLVRRADRTYVTPADLTLVAHYRKFFANDWSNGLVLLVADKKEVVSARDKLTVPLNTPLELFGEEGFEAIDPFIPIHTQLYNQEEADAVHAYYKEANWLVTPGGRSDEGRRQLAYLSGFNPAHYEQLCAFT